MVDRMTAMLNYFLKQLVGPKNEELKVIFFFMHTVLLHFLLFQIKDKDKYHFKPHELVVGIMKIYVNLGKEAEFCKAIPRDGRSFSPDLLSRASNKVISLLVYHSQLG